MLIHPSTMTLGLFGSFGAPELIVLAVLGILLFGKRLPEVGRGIGKGIVEFKKGLQGIEDDIETAGKSATASSQAESSKPQPQLPANDAGTSIAAAEDATAKPQPQHQTQAREQEK